MRRRRSTCDRLYVTSANVCQKSNKRRWKTAQGINGAGALTCGREMKAQERCGVCALKLRLLTSERSFNQEQMEERCCVEHVNVLKHKAGITQSYSGTETLPESIHYTDSFFPPPPSSFKAVRWGHGAAAFSVLIGQKMFVGFLEQQLWPSCQLFYVFVRSYVSIVTAHFLQNVAVSRVTALYTAVTTWVAEDIVLRFTQTLNRARRCSTTLNE